MLAVAWAVQAVPSADVEAAPVVSQDRSRIGQSRNVLGNPRCVRGKTAPRCCPSKFTAAVPLTLVCPTIVVVSPFVVVVGGFRSLCNSGIRTRASRPWSGHFRTVWTMLTLLWRSHWKNKTGRRVSAFVVCAGGAVRES
uniref:Uncharacterized protein n=1 Tax=Ixodes ricinus TaxID=34613 RepID=A0A6B0UTH8_IXORI